MVVEGLGVKFSGGAEARRVVQDGVEGFAGERADLRGDVAVGQGQAAAGFGRPGLRLRSQMTSAFFSQESTCRALPFRHHAAK